MPNLLYFLSGLAWVQGLISLKDGFRNRNYAAGYRRPSAAPPGRVVVFCPVKGLESDLATNAASLLAQSHPDYHVVFVVESDSDPAAETLAALRGPAASEVFVAGLSTARGQKVHNLAVAVERFGDAGEIFVFCDVDAVFGPEWLRELTAPLSGEGVGAATGYRWYVPPRTGSPSRRWASFLRSAWNASVAGYLGPHSNNFTWGGSTAIRKAVFDEAGVGRFWSGALSDDYALTRAVRAVGLEIVYVPACLVPSYESCGWSGLLEFTTRQITITRIYSPGVWKVGFFSHTLFTLTFGWLTVSLASNLFALAPWLALYILAAVRAELRIDAAGRTIPDPPSRRQRWLYRLIPPVVSLLYAWNFISSTLSSDIEWKGIRYTMRGPDQTRVHRAGVR